MTQKSRLEKLFCVKVDKSKPAVFFSRRYRNLLQEFSPKKATNATDELGDMLQRTSVLRNGKLETNFVTPAQLKAVEEFLFGDPTVEKVNHSIIYKIFAVMIVFQF